MNFLIIDFLMEFSSVTVPLFYQFLMRRVQTTTSRIKDEVSVCHDPVKKKIVSRNELD